MPKNQDDGNDRPRNADNPGMSISLDDALSTAKLYNAAGDEVRWIGGQVVVIPRKETEGEQEGAEPEGIDQDTEIDYGAANGSAWTG
ncbi:MAG: hypothetical protein JWN70_203 [Planctomycetaceae bacterium]|nr:hypothetical protein [Planctomycetaceae bacterium]